MRKFLTTILCLTMLIGFGITSHAQGNALAISRTSLVMPVGNYYQLITNEPASNIVWATSNANVVTVYNGIIRATGYGEADIVVRDVSQNTVTCHVIVTNDTSIPPDGMTFDQLSFGGGSIPDILNGLFPYVNIGIDVWKLSYELDENTSSIFPYDYWIQTSFNPVLSNISCYDLIYSIAYTDEQKNTAIQLLRAKQKDIYDFMTLYCPNKKVQGGYYFGYYKYHYVKVGYNSIRFCTWNNYNGNVMSDYNNTSIAGFTWDNSIDDYFKN